MYKALCFKCNETERGVENGTGGDKKGNYSYCHVLPVLTNFYKEILDCYCCVPMNKYMFT